MRGALKSRGYWVTERTGSGKKHRGERQRAGRRKRRRGEGSGVSKRRERSESERRERSESERNERCYAGIKAEMSIWGGWKT